MTKAALKEVIISTGQAKLCVTEIELQEITPMKFLFFSKVVTQ